MKKAIVFMRPEIGWVVQFQRGTQIVSEIECDTCAIAYHVKRMYEGKE